MFLELIVSVMVRKGFNAKMCLILIGYRDKNSLNMARTVRPFLFSGALDYCLWGWIKSEERRVHGTRCWLAFWTQLPA
jgi:hypothetical protein